MIGRRPVEYPPDLITPKIGGFEVDKGYPSSLFLINDKCLALVVHFKTAVSARQALYCQLAASRRS